MGSAAMSYSRAGLDPTFLTDDEFFSALYAQQDFSAMTRARPPLAIPSSSTPLYVDPSAVSQAHYAASQAPDVPAKIASEGYSGSSSGRSNSLSPHAASLVYTPESGVGIYDDLMLDPHGRRDEDGTDPAVQTSPSDSSRVLSNSMGSESSGDHRSMDSNRPPPSTRVPSSGTHSPTPSLVPLTARQPHQHHHHHHHHHQWSSSASTTAAGGWMEGQMGGRYGHFDPTMSMDFGAANYSSAGAEVDLLTGVENFDGMFAHPFDSSLPYRSADLHDASSSFLPRHYIPNHDAHMGTSEYHGRRGMASFGELDQLNGATQQVPAGMPTMDPTYQPLDSHPVHAHVGVAQRAPRSERAMQPPQTLHDVASAPSPSLHTKAGSSPAQNRHPNNRPNEGQNKVGASLAPARPLQPAVPGQHQPRSASQVDRVMARRGGRRKHTHLPDQARLKSHKMRKTGACWGCALQRDPVNTHAPTSILAPGLTI
nr:hypothetical protein CFP56_04246 [Quercus suber]